MLPTSFGQCPSTFMAEKGSAFRGHIQTFADHTHTHPSNDYTWIFKIWDKGKKHAKQAHVLGDKGLDALQATKFQKSFRQNVFVSFTSRSAFLGAFHNVPCLQPNVVSSTTIHAGRLHGKVLPEWSNLKSGQMMHKKHNKIKIKLKTSMSCFHGYQWGREPPAHSWVPCPLR